MNVKVLRMILGMANFQRGLLITRGPYRTLFTRTLESTVPAASTKSSVQALSKSMKK